MITPTAAMPKIARLAIATPIASHSAGNAVCETTWVGSGIIETAPIAVKWWLQIASVNSSAPPIFHFSPSPCRPTGSAIAPISAPSTIETTTRAGSHITVPATSKAAMPR